MKRETQNLLLLLIGGAVLWIALDGSYLRYVKPSLYPFLLVSGAGFVLLALVAIVRDIKRGRASDDHNHDHDHDHDHDFGRGHTFDHADTPGHSDALGSADEFGHAETRGHSDVLGCGDTLGRADVHGRGGALGRGDADGHNDALGRGDVLGGSDAHGDHIHEHDSGRAQWLLLAPIAALLLIAPPALGAGAAVTSSPVQVVPRDAPVAEPKLWAFPPLPSEPAPTIPIVDLVNRALADSSHSLDGREVTIRGFIIRPKDLEQQHPDTRDADLARVVITCCVADARYVLVHLAGMPEVIEDDAWLEVRGVVETGSAQRDPDLTPTFVVRDYQRIEAPDRPYERGR
ncbi:TIGR03943 family putative permease subunit [Nocardia nepalensis]|uniref:TIGR03943 family putative permease subunit n=1 Tax=Nocardia nepalensis TaxID=3375448 RepID=UPI003B684DB7